VKYCYNFKYKNKCLFGYIYSCEGKAEYSASLLQILQKSF